MCSANLRDGTDTREIPKSNSQCANNDCNRDLRFGMHEDIDYYIQCSRRSRNKGLFIAEQVRIFNLYKHLSHTINVKIKTECGSICNEYTSKS